MELNARACACAENNFSRIDLTCNDVCVCVCVMFFMVCVHKSVLHECMYVLCKRFHFRNNASVLYRSVCVLCVCAVCVCCVCAVCVCCVCVCDKYMVHRLFR